MSKQLTSNVKVGDKWYGPDYPKNEVTADVLEQITNPAAFAENPTVTGFGDNRSRVDDFGGEDAPHLRGGENAAVAAATGGLPSREELESKNKDELFDIAEQRGIDVPKSANKDDLLDALTG